MLIRSKHDGWVEGVRRCNFGGGGSSSSSSSQTTNNYDQHQVNTTDARTTNTSTSYSDSRQYVDSRNLSDNSSTSYSDSRNLSDNSTVTYIDAGAVALAKDIGTTALTTNASNTDHLLSVADKLFSQQDAALKASTDLTKSLAGTAASAYADASAQSSGNKNLILAGMAVVGLAAVSMFGKK